MATTSTSGTAAALRTTQIVSIALALGVAIFAAVAAWISPLRGVQLPRVQGYDLLAIVAIVVSLQAIPMSLFLPSKMVEAAREHDSARRIAAFRASRIVAGAVLEGAAILWCVALLLSGNLWYLVPIALLVGLIAWHFPTRDAFQEATGERPPAA